VFIYCQVGVVVADSSRETEPTFYPAKLTITERPLNVHIGFADRHVNLHGLIDSCRVTLTMTVYLYLKLEESCWLDERYAFV